MKNLYEAYDNAVLETDPDMAILKLRLENVEKAFLKYIKDYTELRERLDKAYDIIEDQKRTIQALRNPVI